MKETVDQRRRRFLRECAKLRADAIEIGYRTHCDRLPPEMPENASEARILAHIGIYKQFLKDYEDAAPECRQLELR
jgi:hypothetical protein